MYKKLNQLSQITVVLVFYVPEKFNMSIENYSFE